MGDSPDYSGNGGNMKAVMITGKIMVLAIVVLLVVVVAVLFLHLYARWFQWRIMEEESSFHDRSSRRRRRFVFVPGQDPTTAPRRGLDLAVLRSIPVVVYRPEDFEEGLECAVCLCDVIEDERTRILPKCNHGFHVGCIDMWFQSHSTCPLCRNPVHMGYRGLNKVRGGEPCHAESSLVRDELSERRTNAEASYFPVNMLSWGDEARVRSTNGILDRANHNQPPCFLGESSSSMCGNRPGQNALVIEIPRQTSEDTGSPLPSVGPPDNMKSPVSGRLGSFKRLLSRERKVSPRRPNGNATADIEQG
ncbi:hypothetical protein MLD38_004783 [Melastoma candidum]|uniref:Uncharacterized protein n=1 Tax=Melastoma candidum TaxID=119954 RepID=A0ACB9S8Q1_9MYRT|nr:hypothetical protein MLD38_004783 [Melastoma candidum]